jgi:3-methyladenine DNA glycosylase/8-oxoguanine DNA glycosylase
MSDSLLRALVDLRDRQIQKARIQFGNRLSAIERGDDKTDGQQYTVIMGWASQFQELEKELDADIARIVREELIYEELSAIRGIGPILSAKMIAMIDIERDPTVSALWRYAGYAVINGERERPVKGEKLHYNKRLKTTLHLVGKSFLKCGSPYRAIYDKAKAKYTESKPDWTPLHIHHAAMRKMIKVFLSHLWERWRTLEGLSTHSPYIFEYLGHSHKYEARDFGWGE